MGKPQQQARTLDSEHRDYVQRFGKAAQDCAAMSADVKVLQSRLLLLEGTPGAPLEEIIRLRDAVIEKRNEITRIRAQNDELGYYVSSAAVLFKYYDSLEGCPPSQQDPPTPRAAATAARGASRGPTSILHYFAPTGQEEEGASPEAQNLRGSLLDEYMQSVNRQNGREVGCAEAPCCETCGRGGLQMDLSEGISFCTACGCCSKVLIEVDKPSYKEPQKEMTYYAYKRINHFNEWISQVQGKEFTVIPAAVIQGIKDELAKTKRDIATMPGDFKDKKRTIIAILKSSNNHKYTEHINYIMHSLTGVPPPRMEDALVEKMRHMFSDIQMPYLNHCPKSRTNFLSYSFVMHKLLQLLDRHEFLDQFQLLKSREKLHLQEEIWKKICKDLNWRFIRSM